MKWVIERLKNEHCCDPEIDQASKFKALFLQPRLSYFNYV